MIKIQKMTQQNHNYLTKIFLQLVIYSVRMSVILLQ